MKSIAGKISLILIIVILANIFLSCFSIIAIQDKEGAAKVIPLIFTIPLDIITLPIQLIGFIIILLAHLPDTALLQNYLASVEDDQLMEIYFLLNRIYSNFSETEIISIMQNLKSIPGAEYNFVMEKFRSLSEEKIESLIRVYNSIPEKEIISSIKKINSLSESERLFLLKTFCSLSEEEIDLLIVELHKLSETEYTFEEHANNFPPTIIEQNKIFVLGDNRYNSGDSRYIGQLHKDFVVGKALFIYSSKNLKRIGKIL